MILQRAQYATKQRTPQEEVSPSEDNAEKPVPEKPNAERPLKTD